MLCRRCEAIVSPTDLPAARSGRPTVFGPNRLRALLCERCGVVLPAVDSTESLLEKLSQLALFGLTAEGRPLLESSHEGD